MRLRKRLNLSVLAMALILFSGSAFAYNVGELNAQGQVNFDTAITIGHQWVVNPSGIENELVFMPLGLSVNVTDFSVNFTAPGQTIQYFFLLENNWTQPITVNSDNLRFGGRAVNNSEIMDYDWLHINFLPSTDVVIPADGTAEWGFALTFNPDFRAESYYFADTIEVEIGILQPEIDDDNNLSDNDTSDNDSDSGYHYAPYLPPATPDADNNNDNDDITDNNDTPPADTPEVDAPEAVSPEADADDFTPAPPSIVLDEDSIPLAALITETEAVPAVEYMDIFDIDTPLGAFSFTSDPTGGEYFYFDDIPVPLAALPQTGLTSNIPLFVSGIALLAGVALLSMAQIRKLRR